MGFGIVTDIYHARKKAQLALTTDFLSDNPTQNLPKNYTRLSSRKSGADNAEGVADLDNEKTGKN